MIGALRTVGWIVCALYSTIPAFWQVIHPRASYWRSRSTSPYKILLPIWIAMWAITAAITAPWRHLLLYERFWTCIPAFALFCAGLTIYRLSGHDFTLTQLGGVTEIRPGSQPHRLSTTGIRSYIRHPIYLGHLCEMLAWSVGSGLAVCWALTAFAITTGALMIRMEDQELSERFGERHCEYRNAVPALIPRLKRKPQPEPSALRGISPRTPR
jgi:protein-S-isoprenylcysteine O-methyltransferase Ste14